MFKKNANTKRTEINPQEITTIIGDGFTFTGDLSGNNSIRIEGRIVGNVHVDAGIILGEKGVVEGNIHAVSAIIYGTVAGNVQTLQLEIKKNGKISGDITTDALQIDLGANYNGKLSMHQPHSENKENTEDEILGQAS